MTRRPVLWVGALLAMVMVPRLGCWLLIGTVYGAALILSLARLSGPEAARGLLDDGNWQADYVRLRWQARKPL